MTGTRAREKPSRLAVLKALIAWGPLSRSDLAKISGLSRSILTVITHDLMDLGLLRELPATHADRQRGRPTVLISINPEHAYFVGVCITDGPPLLVLTNLHGGIVSQHKLAPRLDARQVTESVRAAIPRLLQVNGIRLNQILGIGIGVSGFTDPTNQICRYSAALNWHDVPIAEMVRRATRLPTYIDNDANAVAIGESLFGEARGLKNFCIVTLGGSIGSAHYMDGKLYRGHDGGAGEIGHITAVADGLPCQCGKRGCVDMIASAAAVTRAAKGQGLQVESVRDVETWATNGNAVAIALLREAGQALGLAVASVIQINNPELVLFVDVIGFGNGLFSTMVRQTVENNILPRFLACTRLLFHQVEQSFFARGAAGIAANKYLLVQIAK